MWKIKLLFPQISEIFGWEQGLDILKNNKLVYNNSVVKVKKFLSQN